MSREPLTDLDADLRRLLSVTPSPQFEARVRTRISGESMARAWWSGPWTLAVTGAAAAVVIALVSSALVLDGPSSATRLPPPPVVAVTQPPPPLVKPVLPTPVVVPQRARRRAPEVRVARTHEPARTVRATSVTPEPEVLVDARVRANVERLLAMARAGLLKAEDMPVISPGPVDLVVEPLHIPAIHVESKP